MDGQQGKLTIMLADDDPFILELYMAKLKREGFDVYTVGDGEEALLKIDSVRPDLIILDMNMPRIDGLEVLRYIRTSSDRKDMPVIVLSNAVTESMLKDIWDLKPTRFLTKRDSRPNNVLAEIRAVLQDAYPAVTIKPAAQQEGSVPARSTEAEKERPGFNLATALEAVRRLELPMESAERRQALLQSYKLAAARIEALRQGDPRALSTQFARACESLYDQLYSHPELIDASTCRSLRQATELLARQTAQPDLEKPAAVASLRVLVAVEERDVREAAMRAMERLGHNAVCTRDIGVAAALAADNAFDIALLSPGKAANIARLRRKLVGAAAQAPRHFIFMLAEEHFARLEDADTEDGSDVAALPPLASELALKLAMLRLAEGAAHA